MPKKEKKMQPPMEQSVTAAQLAIKSGDSVSATRDDGYAEIRLALSAPYKLGRGDWFVKLEGIAGGYDLARCHKIRDTEQCAEAIEQTLADSGCPCGSGTMLGTCPECGREIGRVY